MTQKTVHLAQTFGYIDVVIANAGGDIQGNDSDAGASLLSTISDKRQTAQTNF